MIDTYSYKLRYAYPEFRFPYTPSSHDPPGHFRLASINFKNFCQPSTPVHTRDWPHEQRNRILLDLLGGHPLVSIA